MNANDVKRFLEWWIGHAEFRNAFTNDPHAAVAKYRIDVDVESVSPLIDGRITDTRNLPADIHPAVVAHLNRCFERMDRTKQVIDQARCENPTYTRWRARQVARYAGQALVVDNERCSHLPYAIELTTGCSLACDYCGFDAGRLSAVARFDENEKLFRDMLQTLANFFGTGAECTFFYWATDPLDNPDYEAYLRAFYDQFGVLLGTTTACWYRDIDRTRTLMEMTRQYNDELIYNRFSINTVRQLELCMKTWSADDLRDVVLALQCPGTLAPKSSSGRGRFLPDTTPMTQATVTGFLINLPDRRVQLISPCIEPERWPNGYRIYAESHFEDAKGLRAFFEDCERRIMAFEIDDTFVPELRPDFRIAANADGALTLTSQYREFTLAHGLATRIASAIDGERSIAEIVRSLSGTTEPSDVRNYIRAWWNKGLIEDLEATTFSPLRRASSLIRSKQPEASNGRAGQ